MRADPYDWRMARRIAFLAANEPGRGIHRNDLARRLGNLGEELPRWIMLAYVQGMVDCVRDWVVAPPAQSPVRLGGRHAGLAPSLLRCSPGKLCGQVMHCGPRCLPRPGGRAMS